MQKMSATPRPSILRKVLEDQFSLLAGELVTLYEQELASREEENRQTARYELAEVLNQGVRLLRQAEDFQQVAGILADASGAFCNVLAVFSVDGDTIRGVRVRGLADEAVAEHFSALEFPAAEAAAFAGVIQNGDPVVAMTTAREINTGVVTALGHGPDDRAFIVPVFARGKAVGMIYAAGSVEMAPLELLAQAAALSIEAKMLPPEPARKPELVMIQGGRSIPERRIPESWTQLSPADQEMHLRAQRFARVQVAGMRLFSPEAVRQGLTSKDLYGALQKDIDSGREMFRQSFLSATPTMVDYFHLELMRTLANDDPTMLGEKYPGPLA
jgi:hypothetical protein